LPLLKKTFFEGYDSTVFTYGQTGAGKSYTMVGDEAKWNGSRFIEGSLGGASSTSSRHTAALTAATPSSPVSSGVPQASQNSFSSSGGGVFAPRSTSSASTRSKKSSLHNTAASRSRSSKPLPPNYSPHSSDGIIPRAINWVFDQKLLDDATNSNYSVQISFLQIYEEKIYDLLKYDSSGPPLRLRYAPKKGFFVENLYKVQVHSPQEAYQLLLDGLKNREVASHDMNLNSSRSHSMFTIEVHSDKDSFKAKCHLCDLPGSEKLSLLSSNPSGKLVKESIMINKSLLALGMVIQALSQQTTSSSSGSGSSRKRSQNRHYVPYRSSKLTSLLKSALGGSSYCTLIACVAPSDEYVLENLSTLYYASRATHIKNTPVKRIDPREKLIQSLKDKIEQLEMENTSLRNIVNQLGGSTMLDGLVEDDSDDEESSGQGAQQADSTTSSHNHESSMAASPDAHQETSETSPTKHSDTSTTNGTAVDNEALKKLKQDNKLLGEKLVDSVKLLKQYISLNSQLNQNVREITVDNEAYQLDNDTLQQENLQLREKIEILQSLVVSDENSVKRDKDDRPYSASWAYQQMQQQSSQSTMPNSDRFRKRDEEELLDSIRRRKEVIGDGRQLDIMERAASVYPATGSISNRSASRKRPSVVNTTSSSPTLSSAPRRRSVSSSGSRQSRNKTPSSFPAARRKSSTSSLYNKKGYIPFSHKYQRKIFLEQNSDDDG